MHVQAGVESLYQMPVLAQVRHNPQFYLRIVRRHYYPSFAARHEGLAYLLPAFAAYRYVLQIRVRRAETSRRRQGLVETGVNLAVAAGNIARERFYIGGEQFLGCAEFEYFPYYGMPVFDREQGLFVRGVVAFLFALQQLQLVVQQGRYLFRRGYVQIRIAGHCAYLFLSLLHLFPQTRCKASETVQVHFHAIFLHLGQNPYQRLFYFEIYVAQALASQFRFQQASQLQGGGAGKKCPLSVVLFAFVLSEECRVRFLGLQLDAKQR